MTIAPYKKISRPMNKRITTGLILGALILLCIYAGNQYTSHLLLAINVLGAYELSKMLNPSLRSPGVYIHILLSITPFFVLDLFGDQYNIFEGLLFLSLIVSIILIILLYINTTIPYVRWSYILALLYWGLPFSLGSYHLAHSGSDTNLVALGIILLIWTSDTMAYFTGKKWGKTKLFESVSPNKTIEGSLGAGVSSVIIAIILALVLNDDIKNWILVGLVVWITGTYGDLVESKIKRVAMVKDSGKMLPGHGGFLDRFDSLVMVIPFLLLLSRLS